MSVLFMISFDEQIIKIIVQVIYFIGLYTLIYLMFVLIFDEDKNTKNKLKNYFPNITITIPCYNEEDNIKCSLESLFESDYPKNKMRVICVNDGSTDNTLKNMKKLQKKYKIEIINFKKNKGKHEALNAALRKTTTELFSCFDSDSYVTKNTLSKLVKDFSDEKISASMPIMKVKNPKNLLERLQSMEYFMGNFFKKLFQRIDCITVVPGPMGTYRTKIIKKIGGFRHGFKTEDCEMTLRLQHNNYKINQSLNCVVYTKAPNKIKTLLNQRVRWYRGTFLTIFKNYRKDLFNKKYKDYGVYVLPLLFFSGIISILSFFAFSYIFIKKTIDFFKRIVLTNFDVVTYIKSFKLTFDILDINWKLAFFFIIMIFLFIFFLSLSFKKTKEKGPFLKKIFNISSMAILSFVYFLLFSIAWLKAFLLVIFKKDKKW